jgi:hypothetical protein
MTRSQPPRRNKARWRGGFGRPASLPLSLNLEPGHRAGLRHFRRTDMNEFQPAPVPAFDFDAWQRQQREHVSRVDALLLANKAALFDVLAAAGITIVIAPFDGEGDSGQIGTIEAKAGEEIVALPSGRIEIASAVWGSCEIKRQTLSIHDAIEAMAYAFLGQTHDGWENNDGAHGDFIFDVAGRTITLDYHERHMESDYSQHVF